MSAQQQVSSASLGVSMFLSDDLEAREPIKRKTYNIIVMSHQECEKLSVLNRIYHISKV